MRASFHRFGPHDLIGGQPALDAVNTVTAWDTDPIDWLADYPSLLQWAELARVIDAAENQALRGLAAGHPRLATKALRAFTGLRLSLQACFTALAQGRTVEPASLGALDGYRTTAMSRSRLVVNGGHVALRSDVQDCGLDLPTHRVTIRAVDLLLRPPGSRLRVCAGHDCGWLFLDNSKSGRRRWCDMSTCGTTDKMARYRRGLVAQTRVAAGAR